MAITPATNVACMKYNGGGNAETICMIDLANDKAVAARQPKKPKTIAGISSIHYMQAEQGGVRVWHVANIGPGRLIPLAGRLYHSWVRNCAPYYTSWSNFFDQN